MLPMILPKYHGKVNLSYHVEQLSASPHAWKKLKSKIVNRKTVSSFDLESDDE